MKPGCCRLCGAPTPESQMGPTGYKDYCCKLHTAIAFSRRKKGLPVDGTYEQSTRRVRSTAG